MLGSLIPEGRRALAARAYDMVPARLLQPTYAHIAREVGVTDGAFLDVGCGPGWLAILVAAGNPQVDSIGIDISDAMIELAEANKGPRLNVTFRRMDATQVIFPDGTFDAAAAVQTVHQWGDPAAILAELHRVLKPDGRLYIYEPDADATDLPAGWIDRKGPWPPDALVLAAWKRVGMDAAAWEGFKQAVVDSPFGGGEDGRHGPFRRLVLTRQ